MPIIDNFCKESKRLKIVVFGDSMIDDYCPVKVERLSPEFPIPVTHNNPNRVVSSFPGGAANVCHQMKDWNVDVYLFSVVDPEALEFFGKFHFDCSNCQVLKEWKSPRKRRFYDGDFPVSRHDDEVSISQTYTQEWSEARRNITKRFNSLIDELNPDVVILSDYGKGMFVSGTENISQQIISMCFQRKIPTIVDPKTVNKNMWQSCTIFKPNFNYVKQFLEKYLSDEEDHNVDKNYNLIRDLIGCSTVIVTDSGNGVYVDGHEIFAHQLCHKRPIIRSVIGAGDCYGAFLAMATAKKMNYKDAVKLAFNAASAYVEDKHNKPISPYRLLKWHDPMKSKIVSVEQLVNIKEQLSEQKWIMTNGCFDFGLTRGHIECLKYAKSKGDQLIVAINSDVSVKKLKGNSRPVVTLEDRQIILSALSCVDFIVSFDEETPIEIVKKIKPAIIVKGGDYLPEEVAGYGISEIDIFPLVDSISTTEKISRLVETK